MFCKNCGTQNSDQMKFCQNCGKAMEGAAGAAEPTAQNPTRPPKGVRRGRRNAAVWALLVAVGLVVAACAAASALTKPERAVKSYITALVEEDYSRLYDSMSIPQGTFTTQKQFVATMEKLSDRADKDRVKNITITEATAMDLKEADSVPDYYFDKAYTVAYLTKDGAHNQQTVFLIKQGKTLFFFDSYRVAPIEYLVEQYEVFAPQYVSVAFDGIQLDSSYLQKTTGKQAAKDGDSCYRLSNVFMGNHDITATAPFISDFATSVFVTQNKQERCTGFEVKPEIKAEMRTMAEDALWLLFDAYTAQKDFAEIAPLLKVVPTQLDAVQQAYEAFWDEDWSGFDSRTVVYENIELTEISPEGENDSSLSQSADAPLVYMLHFAVTCDVKAAPKYILWGDRHTNQRFSFRVNFAYENNELSIYSIN